MLEPYNPLAKVNLGESVANALLREPAKPFGEARDLVGAGVYAIYYVGCFFAYENISAKNQEHRFEQPIYVGKAVPKGARKGGLGFNAGAGRALRDRLGQHAATIESAINLNLNDFYFRAIVVDDIWIPLGENVLIEKFQPLWNRVIDGFGNKTPGAGRAMQQRSSWDVLHPGRGFVEKLGLGQGALTMDQIVQKVDDFYAGNLAEEEKLPGTQEDL